MAPPEMAPLEMLMIFEETVEWTITGIFLVQDGQIWKIWTTSGCQNTLTNCG